MSVQYTDLPRVITKRDGRQETFDPDKLERVLILAYRAVHPDSLVPASWVDSVLAAVLQQLQGVNELTVERCQDVVEDALMITGNHDIAKAYILYRNQRSQIREAKTVEAKIVADLVNVAASGNDEARENANVNADAPMGALLKIGETTLKSYALRSLFKPKHAQMHRDGVIHIHKLNCVTDW